MTTPTRNESQHQIVSVSSEFKRMRRSNDDQTDSRSPFMLTNELEKSRYKIKSSSTRGNGSEVEPVAATEDIKSAPTSTEALVVDTGRERLRRHRVEVAGRVWIPEIWGQEELLKDWIDCTAFDASLLHNRIMLARAAMVKEGRRANSGSLRIENRC